MEWLFVIVGISFLFNQWVCVIQCVPLKFTGVVHVICSFSSLMSGVAQCHLNFPTTINWSGVLSFQVSHYHLLRWLHIISGVPLLLTALTLCHFVCPSDTYWGGFATSQVSESHLLKGLFCLNFSTVSLSLSGISVSFSVSYWCFLGLICITSSHSLSLTGIATCLPRCLRAAS